ncbi:MULTISPECIES: hypothetical protein [Streptomycetaceae]|uniref:Uncharacterized protein n=1 Tax=Streptantibioticus cattleyicolor (strain ATCC 35852 / DSM 46488 / JCM 4925 / NBRC 14057 / NRRL 8057) TaxID=1003195 RepID=F8JPZ9_STREN|nr:MULTISPECIES: hypothetical protein [Streptomycetaceae]AEW94059.1 hypothetical protein SCATT_16880 [Streptantibioticus cattleyicolor NRRL 8057 = DSM 46488]MYS58733.1 hypothetical protein [Streptomyces sp. SID5468]CCB74411.1 exported protein of unknown function [Streptantibioticus cattleyicolor NRRL 8057 = DSM 46488]
MNEFIKKHAVRAFAVLAALVPVLVDQWPGIPWEALAAVVAAILGVGEVTQRHWDARLNAPVEPAAEVPAEPAGPAV